MMDLTNIELFKSLTDFSVDRNNVDLHNEYDCEFIKITENDQLIIGFSKIENSCAKYNKVLIVFSSIKIKSLEFFFDAINNLKPTIDNIYKGRFESNNGLIEADDVGRYCFYISFVENIRFEILSKSVNIETS